MAYQINSLSPIRPFSVSHNKGDRVNEIHFTIAEKREAMVQQQSQKKI